MKNNIFKEFKKTALQSLIFAILIGLLFFFLSHSFLSSRFKISLGVFILAFVVSFLVPIVYKLLKIQGDITDELALISQSAKILDLLKLDKPEIIQFDTFLSKFVLDKIPSEGGGYVLYSINPIKYKEILSNACDLGKSSYNITLTDKYMPSFFFTDDKKSGVVIFPKAEKQDYLKRVNSLPKRIKVTRILIFDEKNLEIKDIKNKIDFYINFHSNVQLFWIKPEDLKLELEEDAIDLVLKNDFGIVDNSLIINNIENKDKCEILLSKHNYKFNKIFEILTKERKKKNNRKFKKYAEIIDEVKLIDDFEKNKNLIKEIENISKFKTKISKESKRKLNQLLKC